MKAQAVYQTRAASFYKASHTARDAVTARLLQCDEIKARTKNPRIAKKCEDRVNRFGAVQPTLQKACVGADNLEPKALRKLALKLSRIVRSSGMYMKGLHGIQSNSLAYGYRG